MLKSNLRFNFNLCLCQMVYVCFSRFKKLTDGFLKLAIQVYIPTTSVWELQLLKILVNVWHCKFFLVNFSHSNEYALAFPLGLCSSFLQNLMILRVTCSLAVHISSFVKCLFKSFPHIFNWVIFLIIKFYII